MNIKGLRISNYEYNFLIDGKVTVDPCARKITGRENFGVPVEEEHAIRCAVLSKSYDLSLILISFGNFTTQTAHAFD